MISPSKTSQSSDFRANLMHYIAVLVIFAVCLTSLLYSSVFTVSDHYGCDALLKSGRWLRAQDLGQWQPEGCMLHPYKSTEVTECLRPGSSVLVIGDSLGREMFFAMLKRLASTLDTNGEKHTDRIVDQAGIHWEFIWDPYLNSSAAERATRPVTQNSGLTILSSGLWYLNKPESGGQLAWQAQLSHLQQNILESRQNRLENWLVMMPVEDPIEARLSEDKASRMAEGTIAEMNNFLLARDDLYHVPTVFNSMLTDSADAQAVEAATEDGIHFTGAISQTRADILYNLRCNNIMPKHYPMDKTCCMQYRPPNFVQVAILAFFMLWVPLGMVLRYATQDTAPTGQNPSILRLFPKASGCKSLLVFGGCCALIFLADRTRVFSKEDKLWNPLYFAALSALALLAGLATLKSNEKDTSFLNRDQTDEWKGWMQLAILIYHYLGASRISPIYNSIRAVVAAYLFMTGYGHFTYWYKKKDFGYARIFSSLVRLNLLTVVLAYLMDTDFLFYYFSPLVSFWFIIIYATMGIGRQWNDNDLALLAKVVFSAALVGFLYHGTNVITYIFAALSLICRIDWDAREWSFRIGLDQWIVYIGMLTAFAVIKAQKTKLMESPRWQYYKSTAIAASAIGLGSYLVVETFYSKFEYNPYQPYVSMIPILSFVVLRNATLTMRARTSQFFAFFGRCSLETFIVQFHLWLAADTKGILMVIPFTTFRSINFLISTMLFVYISHILAQTTAQLTTWISQVEKKSSVLGNVAMAPLPMSTIAPADSRNMLSDASESGHPLRDLAEDDADKVALLGTNRDGALDENEIEIMVSDQLDIPDDAALGDISTKRARRRWILTRLHEIYSDMAADLRGRTALILLGLWIMNWLY